MSRCTHDVDRVHGGKTFAQCHQIAGWIGLEYETVLCKVTNYREIEYILKLLIHVLDEQGLSFSRYLFNENTLFTGKTKVRFIVDNEFEEKTKGCNRHTTIYVDMTNA